MSNGKSWADLISGKVQIKEPKKYLREEINEDPTNIFTLFMNGLKSHLEKDIQQDVLSYHILAEGSPAVASKIIPRDMTDSLINFNITLPNQNPEQSTVLIFFACITYINSEQDYFGFMNKNFVLQGIFTRVAPANSNEAETYLNNMKEMSAEKLFKSLENNHLQMDSPTPEAHPDIDFIRDTTLHISERDSAPKRVAITKDIEKAGYEKYAQESNWEAIYQYIQETIMKHPALQG
ncbi:MAG: hypothetical protein Q4E16_03145 [Neisseria sp.]|nr:hypothetical protein [Neisseria sp.]